LTDQWERFHQDERYTYCDLGLNAFSCIDRWMVSNDLRCHDAHVMHEASNPSKHSCIGLSVQVPGYLEQCRFTTVNPNHNTQRIEWHKAMPFVNEYRREMERLMAEIEPKEVMRCTDVKCNNNEHLLQMDEWAQDLVRVALDSDHVFPRKRSGDRRRRQLCGWNEHVRPVKDDMQWWFNTWKALGQPRNGIVFDNMRESRRTYAYAVRSVKRRQRELKAERFAQALTADRTRDLFAEARKMSPRPTLSNFVDNITDECEIADHFANKYQALYNSLSSDPQSMSNIQALIMREVESSSRHMPDAGCFVNLETIKQAVRKLKHGKSDGDAGLYSSHLIYACEVYFCHLSLLFNSMYVHGYLASPLLTANIVSIPKDYRKSLSDGSNYRGIALCSSLSKMLEIIIMKRNEHAFGTSELQFAFKAGHSTAMCSYAVKEVVKYYMDRGSTVYACFLDATKAFDRVQFDKMFNVLIDNNVMSVDLRLLYFQYTNQKCRAEWKGNRSEYFSVGNGIRQGGIASPVIFCMYLDVLIRKLERERVGCNVGTKYFGCLAYADDLVLLSPSIQGLRKMLRTCEEYCDYYRLQFNATKSACVCFSRKRASVPPSLCLAGVSMKWTEEVKHLGNIINCDLNEQNEINVKRGDLVGRVNSILANFNFVSNDVKLKLFFSQCAHLYGCQAWNLGDKCVSRFYTMYNQCIRRVLKLPYRTHTRLLPYLTGRPGVKSLITRRMRKFINTVIGTQGRVGFLAELSVRNRMSILGRNNDIASKAEEPWCAEDAAVAQAILELSEAPPTGLTYLNARDMISFLCTL